MQTHSDTKIALFSPFALVWQHALPASVIARTLGSSDNPVDLITCNGALSAACIVFRSRNLDPLANPSGARRLCRQCKRVSRQRITREFNHLQLDRFIRPAERHELEAFCNLIVAGPVTDDSFRGHPIGRFALYTHTIGHRAETTDVKAEHLEAFRAEVRSVGLALLAGEVYATENSPEIVLVSDLFYGANRGFISGVKNKLPDVRAVGIYDSPNQAIPFTTFQWAEDVQSTPFAAAKAAWPLVIHPHASPSGIEAIGKYLTTSIAGTRFRSFSGATEMQSTSLRTEVLGVDANETIALVALSSEDEALAARESGGVSYLPAPYATQLEWLKDIARIAETEPDTRFVIRPHPRFWTDERNTQRLALEKLAPSLSHNVSLLPPERYASLYGLINEADIVLTSWSTVGIEARLLGVPTLAYGQQQQAAPPSVLPAPDTKEAYEENLRTLLRHGSWSLDIAIDMFRWIDFAWHQSTLDLQGVLPTRVNHQTRASTQSRWDYLDLASYRFLPAVMAWRDTRYTNDTESLKPRLRSIVESGIVMNACSQGNDAPSQVNELKAIGDVLGAVGRLLPVMVGDEYSTLRGRLLGLCAPR
jgi:hypothetical protein